jgi:hypothetical protein
VRRSVLVSSVLIAVVISGGAVTAATVADAVTFKTFGDGTYRVGRDVPPGTYRTRGGVGCYWARLRNFSGNLNAIIANDNAVGPAVVTIKRTDRGIESNRCGTWTSNLSRITKSKTRFAAGTYIVRTDIAPGTYRARGAGCYWARLRAFTGELNAIIANGNPSGQVVVTISRSDRGFTSTRCGVWIRF